MCSVKGLYRRDMRILRVRLRSRLSKRFFAPSVDPGEHCLAFPLPRHLPSSMGPSLIRGGRRACWLRVPSCGGIRFLLFARS